MSSVSRCAHVLGVDDEGDGPLMVHVQTRGQRPRCEQCGRRVWIKDTSAMELVDLPAFGRPARLVWHKHRWFCPNPEGPVGAFVEVAARIAPARAVLSDRAARWATRHVGKAGPTVAEVAAELGCDWHTVNNAVITYGQALLEADTDRIGHVEALGLDETLFNRTGQWRRHAWCTSIVDVGCGQLLDLVEGRTAAAPSECLANQPAEWREAITWAVLDLSGPYRATFNTMLPDATQVADPFHVHQLANRRVDEVRRRVQHDTVGHRWPPGPQRRAALSDQTAVDQSPRTCVILD